MPDLAEQLRTLARSLDEEVEPVSAAEARRLADLPRRWWHTTHIRPLAVAAAVLAVIGLATAITRAGGDHEGVVTTPGPGERPLTLDGHRDWMLDLVNDEIAPDDDTIRLRFAPDFLESVPPAEVRAIAVALRPSAPWAASTEVERRDDALATQIIGHDGTTARLTLLLDDQRRVAAATVLLTRDCGALVPVDEAALAGDEPVGWAFGLINGDRGATDTELEARLSEQFLAEVPGDEFRRRLAEIHALGPYEARTYEGAPTDERTVLLVGLRTGEEAQLVVETTPSGEISVLSLTTQQPCAIPG